jgi:hypothetical protein
MRAGQTVRVRLAVLAAMLGPGALVPLAWAQAESPPPPWVGEGHAELTLILASVVVLVLLAGAKAIDLKRKRADEAVRLQAQIADALLRDRRLATLPVVATVHIPGWRGSPPRIEVCGQVPTAELWQAARRVAEQEASRSLAAFHLDDRIAVVPSMRARVAQASPRSTPQLCGNLEAGVSAA